MDLCRLLLTIALLALFATMCPADGGFIPVVEGVANTADQRAIIIDRGGAETIVLQTAYEGDASDFAWVIPLPELISAQDAISTADPTVFEALDEMTGPRYLGGRYQATGLCGCSGSEQGTGTDAGVTVWETLRVDGYDVAVLSAEQSSDLGAWLSANGYRLPSGSPATLQYYVDRRWYFVALKIAPTPRGNIGGGPPGDGGADLRPIVISFDTPRLIFPLRISRISTRNRVEILLYVIGRHRAESDNYATAEVHTPQHWTGGDFAATYDGWLENTLSAAGGRALAVEYAGWIQEYFFSGSGFAGLGLAGDTWYVTRLRTRLSPEQMDADIVLTAAASDDAFEVVVGDGYARLRGTGSLAMLALAGLQGLVVRSRRGHRMAIGSLLCALLIILV